MKKTGILTFHYSNNYGGVLQSYALYNFVKSINENTEIINFVPSTHNRFLQSIYVLRDSLRLANDTSISVVRAMQLKKRYGRAISLRFERFRAKYLSMSVKVDEAKITGILPSLGLIVVGSDQIWNPSQRDKPEYFLGFDEFKGKKVSYAADSTTAEVSEEHLDKLKRELGDFDSISVRNEHSQKFVETVIGEKVPIVADPTLLWDFNELGQGFMSDSEPYILVYVLGKDINGSNEKAIEKIKRVYGDLRVYAVVIPTMKFNICDYADKVFYDLGPEEWLDMIRNATFVYTDSFHGTLFSLKFHKPFLAYYAEEMRATRFIDLGKRYEIERYIVNSVDEIDTKGSLLQTPDFAAIDQIIEEHRAFSIRFLEEALGIDG